MSIREKLNQNSTLATAGAAVLIVLALGAVAWQFWPAAGSEATLKRFYFTTDDGKTLFAEDITKVPPFKQDGKDAYHAMVYKCGWGKQFVGYLTRYTPEMKQRMEEAIAAGRPLDGQATVGGAEIKKPGEAEWVKATDDAATRVGAVLCPDGTLNGLKVVWP